MMNSGCAGMTVFKGSNNIISFEQRQPPIINDHKDLELQIKCSFETYSEITLR